MVRLFALLENGHYLRFFQILGQNMKIKVTKNIKPNAKATSMPSPKYPPTPLPYLSDTKTKRPQNRQLPAVAMNTCFLIDQPLRLLISASAPTGLGEPVGMVLISRAVRILPASLPSNRQIGPRCNPLVLGAAFAALPAYPCQIRCDRLIHAAILPQSRLVCNSYRSRNVGLRSRD
jgi:hypothetical protein